MNPHLYLVDAYGFVFRAYYALPPLSRKDGLPTGAVFGFCTMLRKLLQNSDATHFAVAFDGPKKVFRHTVFPDYKANRKPPPEDLVPQFALVREATQAFGLQILEAEGFEADDLIATYAKEAQAHNARVTIVSSDKDFMQLVGENVRMYDAVKNRFLGIPEVKEYFGANPSQVVDIQALAGDSSDNVPGVPGIGIKTAAQLINSYSSLKNLFAHLEDIPQKKRRQILSEHKDMAFLSQNLVRLRTDAPKPFFFKNLIPNPNPQDLGNFFTKMEFFALLRSTDTPKEKILQTNTLDSFLKNPEPAIALSLTVKEGQLQKIHLASQTRSGTFKGSSFSSSLKTLLENPGVIKICHDVATVLKFFPNLYPFEDVALLSYALDGPLSRGQNKKQNLARLSQHYFSKEDVPEEDAVRIFALWKILFGYLAGHAAAVLYARIDKPLVRVLRRMEDAGIQVDTKALQRLDEEFTARLSALKKEICEQAGISFNPGSPKQLGKILFEHLALPKALKTRTGAWRTDSDILRRLKHPLADLILEWRRLAKLQNTYTQALQKAVSSDGRVHTTFSQTTTTTGRLSSSQPNLQNIPVRTKEGQRIRNAFVAPPGCVLISADYNQIELRLLAHMADVPVLRNALEEGVDLHAFTAQEIFGDKTKRSKAKAVNFGIIYGMSAFGLANQIGVSREEAATILSRYFERFAGLQEYMEKMKCQARAQKFVKTVFGRRCPLPEINSPIPATRAFMERAAINAPLQGSAADIMRRAMILVDKALKFLNARMLLQIHDELLLEAPQKEAEQVCELAQNLMPRAGLPHITVPVVVRQGKFWT